MNDTTYPNVDGAQPERKAWAKELKLVCLRETPLPADMALCDTADKVAEYWNATILKHPFFNPEAECMVVLILNVRRRIKGHVFVATGTGDTILIHPTQVFRAAIVAGANSIILIHNHPSGDSSPSEADIKVTRDLIRAGQLLKLEVTDHVIMGHGQRTSLRELGYFYAS